LTSVELSLVEHVGRGERLDLAADDEAVDEAAMRSWGESRTCRATVIRDILRGRLAADPDPRGLWFRGARITGRLDLQNVATDVSLELIACFLEEGVLARDARLASVVLRGCLVEHSAEPPLDGARLTCTVLALDGATVIGHSGDGAVCLLGAHIGGHLGCVGADLRNDSGPALYADGLQVGQAMFLRGGFTATGSGEGGAVRLAGAHIGGQLDCTGAELRNDSGPALNGDSLQVGQAMFLRGGFTATGSGEGGAVRLAGAHIGGQLSCAGADLRNGSGPALNADGLQVGQGMYLRRGFTPTGSNGAGRVREFTAIGSAEDGAVRLVGAHIGGQLGCVGVDLLNGSGPALHAEGLQVGQGMILVGRFTVGRDAAVAVDLTGARVDGTLIFAPRLAHAADPHRRLAVDGLTYAGVPQQISARDWLALLRDGTPGYAAQPYQQLAAGYRALGDERQAREILIAQRDDELTRTHTRWSEKLWGKITKVTLGYGYQPWRALWFLAGVVVVSCVLAVVLGAHGALAQASKTAAPGRSCTLVQQVSVGLDLNLPVGTSVARTACDLTTDSASATGDWLTAIGWVLRVLAWMFAALFIAGFTSAVRKT
jgi:hypothetical protein